MTMEFTAEHEKVWDLIPWYVNGTLDPGEAALAERHIAACLDCQAELVRQEQLNDVIVHLDDVVPEQDAALDAIAARLSMPKERPGWINQIRGLLSSIVSTPLGGMKVSAGLAAAALLVMVVMWPQNNDFQTLTTPDATGAGIEIRVRYAPDIDPETVRALLRDYGATRVSEPTTTALIRAEVAPAQKQEIVDALRDNPLILFVAVDD